MVFYNGSTFKEVIAQHCNNINFTKSNNFYRGNYGNMSSLYTAKQTLKCDCGRIGTRTYPIAFNEGMSLPLPIEEATHHFHFSVNFDLETHSRF